jgi:hypothetical protein
LKLENINCSIAASTAAAAEAFLPPVLTPSSLRIVPFLWPSAIWAFVAADRFTKNVSSASLVLSPLAEMVIVLLVCPGRNVSVPLWTT